MDNIFFNASHTDTAPAQAFHRPKHEFKGIVHGATPQPQEDMSERASQPAPKQLLMLPAPPALHHASPNRARQMLGLPSLPRSPDGCPRLMSDVEAETQNIAAVAQTPDVPSEPSQAS